MAVNHPSPVQGGAVSRVPATRRRRLCDRPAFATLYACGGHNHEPELTNESLASNGRVAGRLSAAPLGLGTSGKHDHYAMKRTSLLMRVAGLPSRPQRRACAVIGALKEETGRFPPPGGTVSETKSEACNHRCPCVRVGGVGGLTEVSGSRYTRQWTIVIIAAWRAVQVQDLWELHMKRDCVCDR